MDNFENYITVEDHGHTFYKCALCRHDFHTQEQMNRHLEGIHKIKVKSKEEKLRNPTPPDPSAVMGLRTPSRHKRAQSEIKAAEVEPVVDELEEEHSFEDEPEEKDPD